MIVDMVRDDTEGCLEFSAPPFDKLRPNQKLAVLAEVGTALLAGESAHAQADGGPGRQRLGPSTRRS